MCRSAATASPARSCPRARCSRRTASRATRTSTPPWRGTSAAAAPTRASAPRSREPRRREVDASRRDFLRLTASAALGGGLLLGFGLPARGGAAGGPAEPFAPNAFLRIDRAGNVTFVMPYVEMGQGTYTSIPMLIAEELDVELGKVTLEHAPADDKAYANPLIGLQFTGSSTSIRGAYVPL